MRKKYIAISLLCIGGLFTLSNFTKTNSNEVTKTENSSDINLKIETPPTSPNEIEEETLEEKKKEEALKNSKKEEALKKEEAKKTPKEKTLETLAKKYPNIDLGNPLKIKSPVYINGILLVNKDFALPSSYNPGYNKEMLNAFNKMKAAASKDNITLNIGSGFRTYNYQVSLYNGYVQNKGQAYADKTSAKPGHSEHQSGLTVDIIGANPSTNINSSFDNTKESKWLAKNAHKFGFILRFPKGKEKITGYKYESWHYRYIGTKDSVNFNNNNLTLEEYLGLA